MDDTTTRLEPKRLFKRLTELSGALDPDRPLEEMLVPFLDQLLAVVRSELDLVALLLYAEGHDGFRLVKLSGDLEQIPAETFDRSLPFLQRLANSRFLMLYPHSAGRPTPQPTGLLQPDAAAAILFGQAPKRYLMLFVLGDSWQRDDVEYCLNTVRAVLSSRLTQERIRVTLEEAAAIQTSLFVDEAPPFPGYDIAFRWLAAEEVGGDLYDFIPFDQEILGVAIGDACGHGLSAALLVRDVVTGLRMGLEKDLKVSYVFRKLNRVVHRSRLSSRFVSLFYGELEANGNLIYINAGHCPPLLFLGDRVEELRTGGVIVGPLANAQFKRGFAHIDRGATLLLVTDGILERRDAAGKQYGQQRLIELVRSHPDEPSTALVRRIFDDARRFGDGARWEDDTTVIVIRRDRK